MHGQRRSPPQLGRHSSATHAEPRGAWRSRNPTVLTPRASTTCPSDGDRPTGRQRGTMRRRGGPSGIPRGRRPTCSSGHRQGGGPQAWLSPPMSSWPWSSTGRPGRRASPTTCSSAATKFANVWFLRWTPFALLHGPQSAVPPLCQLTRSGEPGHQHQRPVPRGARHAGHPPGRPRSPRST